VGVADERGETGRVHGQRTHVTEDHEKTQGEEKRVSQRPVCPTHVAGEGTGSCVALSTTGLPTGATRRLCTGQAVGVS
jgi:hypothetical protein